MMGDVHFINARAEKADQYRESCITLLERVIEDLRQTRLRGLMIVAFKDGEEGSDVEMTIERFHIAKNISDTLITLGLNKVYADEVSAFCNAAME